MSRLEHAEQQRQIILDSLADNDSTLVQLVKATGMEQQRLAQYLLRMERTGEVKRSKTGKRSDGRACYLYHAIVRWTTPAIEVQAKLACNVNGKQYEQFVRLTNDSRPAPKPVQRLFGGL